MGRAHRILPFGLAAVATAGLTGCIAPDIDVVGALGVKVTEDGSAVIVVEPCQAQAITVDLTRDREGLDGSETNETLRVWRADPPTGAGEIVIGDVAEPWQGESFDLEPGRGYISGGQGAQPKEVLTQVSFRTDDLAGFDPAMVYTNTKDVDSSEMQARSPAEFTAWACGRRR